MLEIEKTKPTFIISVLKIEYLVVLVSLRFPTFLVIKFLMQINGRGKKIPTCSNSALDNHKYSKNCHFCLPLSLPQFLTYIIYGL